MCISHFMFFANDLLLAVYFIFFLDYGNYVRQKADLSDFLIQVQNGSFEATETTDNNSTFGPRTANKRTV